GLGAEVGAPGEGTSWLGLLLGAALTALVLLTPAGFGVIAVLAAGGLAAFVMGWIAMKQIGGYTGDVLGAGQQVSETAALVAASGVILPGASFLGRLV
ncbi:MAG: adenosylcobinamide-GDP ribazoletransferase, partial [Alphaproteobacteria bacterium]|nr:adenosylcobinamide-GDP ribazoletransferase [Alphaproteobacteria bacterium]